MESNNNQISIDIPNYSGPLDVLLDLAKTQKVDLAEISITKLADQFLQFIKNSKNLNDVIPTIIPTIGLPVKAIAANPAVIPREKLKIPFSKSVF